MLNDTEHRPLQWHLDGFPITLVRELWVHRHMSRRRLVGWDTAPLCHLSLTEANPVKSVFLSGLQAHMQDRAPNLPATALDRTSDLFTVRQFSLQSYYRHDYLVSAGMAQHGTLGAALMAFVMA